LFNARERTCYLTFMSKTSPTDKGYAPTMFLFQKKIQQRQTNNSQLKETQVLDG